MPGQNLPLGCSTTVLGLQTDLLPLGPSLRQPLLRNSSPVHASHTPQACGGLARAAGKLSPSNGRGAGRNMPPHPTHRRLSLLLPDRPTDVAVGPAGCAGLLQQLLRVLHVCCTCCMRRRPGPLVRCCPPGTNTRPTTSLQSARPALRPCPAVCPAIAKRPRPALRPGAAMRPRPALRPRPAVCPHAAASSGSAVG